MMQCDGPEKAIAASRATIASAGFSGKVKIAFDEWNLRGWHHPEGNGPGSIAARDRNDIAATYTMADALFSAAFFNACLRNADIVAMANVSPSVNARGPLFVHPEGIVKRTSFHAMKLYVEMTRDWIIDSRLVGPRLEKDGRSVAAIEALVSADDSGTTIAITNRDPKNALPCAIELNGHRLSGNREAILLDGASPDAFQFRRSAGCNRAAPICTQRGKWRLCRSAAQPDHAERTGVTRCALPESPCAVLQWRQLNRYTRISSP